MEPLLLAKRGTNQMKVDQAPRLHGIDALRAIAMILGMLLHATIAYKVHPLPNWPHDNGYNNWVFDFAYHFVHSFRMPLFFLIAGYFSRLLFHKLGEKEFIKHRFKRIMIPFIFSLIFILPFSILPFSVYRYMNVYPGQWNLIFQHSYRELWHWHGLAHLWFLYYLLIYYTTAIIYFRVMRMFFSVRIPALASFLKFFHPAGYRGIAFFVLLVWITLLASPELYLNVDTGIIPGAFNLSFYAAFFLMGWLINKKPESFTWISGNFWLFISLGSALCVMLFLVDFNNYANKGWQMLLIKLPVALQIVLLVYGVIGFFLRYCQVQNKFWRYISDASYWMYLTHLALIAGLQIYFMNTSVPGIFRFLLIVILPLAITLLTYQYFVRFTIIGNFLHGKRKRMKDGL